MPDRPLARTAAPLPRRIGRYVVRREIGRGGMGVVYQAHDPDLQREVALKVLLGGDHAGAEAVERFLREGRAGGAVTHPSLVRVYHTGWADGLLHVTMELLPGPSLAQRLGDGERLATPEIVAIGIAVAEALHAAHARGFVHRDVKPGNILFREGGAPVLGDFGLAAELGRDSGLTRSGQILGTPAYLAPEQTGRAPASAAADQYSLGAVLWHLVAGRAPYHGDTAAEIVLAVVAGPPPPLAEVAPRTPPGLARVIETAMRRDPATRYPTCAALAEDLRRFARGEPVRAPPEGAAARVRAWARRRRTWFARGGLALAAGAMAWGGWGLWEAAGIREARQERERAAAVAYGEVRPEARVAFAADPRFAGTRAATRALLDAAARDPANAVTHFAAAYAATADPADQDAALRGLARAFRSSWRFDALRRVLERVEARSPGARAEPELARWAAEAAVAQRRFDEVTGVPVLSRWRQARPLGRTTRLSAVGDTDEDGVLEWWSADGAELRRARLLPGDAPAWEVVERFDAPISRLELVRGGLVAGLGEPGAEARTVIRHGGKSETLPVSAVEDALRLDDDTLLLALGPYDRRLVAWTPGRTTSPAPAIDALGSDVTGLAWWDGDADGTSDLVVSVGPWSAYDLRLYPGARLDRPPAVRRKVGYLSELRVRGAALWGLDSDEYPSRVMFPPDRPTADPSGAVRFGRGLAAEVRLPSPAPEGRPVAASALVLADLDGNGRDDAVWTVGLDERRWLVVWPDADPAGAPFVIEQLSALFAADLDPAPGDELVVFAPDPVDPGRGEAWLLGAGSDRVPVLPELPPARPAVRDAAERRAEELVAMGLAGSAAEELARLGDRTSDPRLRTRAAELWSSIGDDEAAADALLAAARATGDPTRFDRAADALARSHRFEAAVEAAREAGRPREPLERELATVREEALALGGSLPAAVRVLDRTDVTPDLGRAGLAWWAIAEDGPALAVPLTLDPGRFGLALDARVDRAEWGSGARAVADVGGVRVELGVRLWGGGALLRRELYCGVGDRYPVSVWEDATGPDDAVDLHLAVDLSAAAGTWRCDVGRAGGARRVETGALRGGVPGGATEVVLGPTDHAAAEGLAARVLLRTLTVTGSGLRLGPAAGAPPGPWELVALADVGEVAEATARLRALPGDLVPELRSRLGTLGPVVEAARGDELFAWFERAFGAAFQAHPDDPELVRALTTGLPTLSARAPALEGPLRQVAGRLLVDRARAWLVLGQTGAAERDLAQAVPLVEPAAGLELALAWLDLAEAVAAREGPERARALVARARGVAPPEIVDDLVALRPALR